MLKGIFFGCGSSVSKSLDVGTEFATVGVESYRLCLQFFGTNIIGTNSKAVDYLVHETHRLRQN